MTAADAPHPADASRLSPRQDRASEWNASQGGAPPTRRGPTRDRFLGGRLTLWQPRDGYRAGIDAVLLAAACPAKPGQSVLELGCGAGTAALCLAARVPDLALTGVEREPRMVGFARCNAALSGSAFRVVEADIAALPRALRQRRFDHVIANPPYFLRGATAASPDPLREGAMGEETPLSTWIEAAARRLAPKGRLTLIQRAERLDDVLAAARTHLGSLEILPLAPRSDRPARFVLLRAVKSGRAQLILHAPIVLHRGMRHEQDGDDYTPEISAVLREGKSLRGFAG